MYTCAHLCDLLLASQLVERLASLEVIDGLGEIEQVAAHCMPASVRARCGIAVRWHSCVLSCSSPCILLKNLRRSYTILAKIRNLVFSAVLPASRFILMYCFISRSLFFSELISCAVKGSLGGLIMRLQEPAFT